MLKQMDAMKIISNDQWIDVKEDMANFKINIKTKI